jgi:predicted PurR-regulated permease PerM
MSATAPNKEIANIQQRAAAPVAVRYPSSTAAKIIIAAVVGLVLYVAHVAFIPIALALLFALILSWPVEALYKLRIPRSASAAFILVLFLAVSVGIVNLMWGPAQQWFADAPRTMAIIKQKAQPLARFIIRVEELRTIASNMSATNRSAPPVQAPTMAQEGGSALLIVATRGALVGVVTFLIVTLFLLAGGPPMLARMTAAFVDDLNAARVLHILDRVRAELGRFYVTTAAINLGFGIATAALMTVWGMPTPYIWGVLAAVLNFIPYVGATATLIVIMLVAFVSFDSLGSVVGVAGSYVALATIEGQIAQPLLVGRRLEVNPLLVFLALWFGGLFWGIAGIILATPTLLALKVISENARGSKAMREFLGPNDQTANRDEKLRQLIRKR